jgi:hypothetical protein
VKIDPTGDGGIFPDIFRKYRVEIVGVASAAMGHDQLVGFIFASFSFPA